MFGSKVLKISSTFCQYVYTAMIKNILSSCLPQTILISLREGSNDKPTSPSILKRFMYPARRKLSLLRSFINKIGHLLSECLKTSRPDYRLEDETNSQMLKHCRLLCHHFHFTSDLLPVITGE
jgi:hypothetical protein